MSAAWVAAAVRSRAMARRRLGLAASRELAAAPGLAAAIDRLVASPYGHDVRPGMDLAQAQRAVSATMLWHMRVLAGWVPGDSHILRVLAGGFEVANVDEHIRAMGGHAAAEPFELGSLATAWPRLAATGSLAGLREVLAASAWRDPGGSTAGQVHLAIRLSWAHRVAAAVPSARAWARGAAAILVARECVVGGRRPAAPVDRLAEILLGRDWAATSLRGLATTLPHGARWALAGVEETDDLYRAEAALWHRVGRDGAALLRGRATGPAPVVGAVGVLAADAWRVRAALDVAARRQTGEVGVLEAFDAVA